MAWNAADARVAQGAAENDFHEFFAGLTEEQKQGIRILRAWWAKWYNGNTEYHATGHKHLARLLIKSVSNPK